MAKISDLETPTLPKTTFTVGTVRGGTSVNAIAGEARIGVDMRSSDNNELAKIVQAYRRSVGAVGREVKTVSDGSTDSNIAMSLGVPAITIGGGGESDGQHSLREWYKPTDAYLGPQSIFLTLLGLTGFEDVSRPLLEKRAR